MSNFTKEDIATRKALLTPEELKEFGEEPRKEEIEKGVEEAKKTTAEIGAGVRALAEIDLNKAPPLVTNADEIRAAGVGVLAEANGDMEQFQTALTEMMKATGVQQEATQKGILGWVKGLTERREEVRAGQPTTQELITQTMEQFGLTPESLQRQRGLIGQATAFSSQQADLEAQKQARLLGAEQQFQGRLTSALRGEQGLIERQYNSKIAAKAAQASVIYQQLQLERGLWSDALQMTNMIVESAVFDQKQQLADITWAQNTYTDLYQIMSKEEQTAWDRQLLFAQDALDEARTEKSNVNNLMLQYPRAGITIDDTVDEATKKASEWAAAIPDVLSVAEAKSLGVPYGTTRQQAIAMGITPTPEAPTIITQSTLNKLAAAGVPNDVALDIQGYINTGIDDRTILGAMIDTPTIGKEKAIAYMKAYREVMSQLGVIQVGVPTIKEAPDYEAMAEEIEATTLPSVPEEEPESWWGRTKRWWSGIRE